MLKPEYEEIGYFTSNEPIRVKKNGLYGYVDFYGKIIIEPQFKDAANKFSKGTTGVKKDTRFHLVDSQLRTIVIVDKLCGHDIIRDSKERIIWPKKSKDELCLQEKH